eukprot:1101219-Amphidinium_carterae.1
MGRMVLPRARGAINPGWPSDFLASRAVSTEYQHVNLGTKNPIGEATHPKHRAKNLWSPN